jgi:CubicO group peptidase (beta-lactamase class C family)
MENDVVELDVRDDRLERAANLFETLVADGHELGGSFAVYRGGELLAAGHGGTARVGTPWQENTVVQVYSVGKPLVALSALLSVRDGYLTLDDPVRRWWPDYADDHEQATTLRMMLCHTSGKPVFPPAAGQLEPTNSKALIRSLAAAPPRTSPGSELAEHALTYGHLVDGLLAAAGAPSVSERLAEIANWMGLQMWFGVPTEHQHRIADLEPVDARWPSGFLRECLAQGSLQTFPALYDPSYLSTARWRECSFGGIGLTTDARSLGRFYDDLHRPDGIIGSLLGSELRRAMIEPAATGRDAYLGEDVTWSLGMRVDDSEFGMGGIGGSSAWYSRKHDYSMAYVTRGLADHVRLNAVADLVEEDLSKRG